jgi:hypothetical protein
MGSALFMGCGNRDVWMDSGVHGGVVIEMCEWVVLCSWDVVIEMCGWIVLCSWGCGNRGDVWMGSAEFIVNMYGWIEPCSGECGHSEKTSNLPMKLSVV